MAALGPGRSLKVRLEDLCLEPQRELRAVCDFLGEPWDADMLEYHRTNSEQQLEPREFLVRERRHVLHIGAPQGNHLLWMVACPQDGCFDAFSFLNSVGDAAG